MDIQNKEMKTVEFNIGHGKPFFPANSNAEQYIEQTLVSTLSKLPEYEDLKVKLIRSSMSVRVKFNFSVEDMGRIGVIENRVNKIGKNICKKFKTIFDPVEFDVL